MNNVSRETNIMDSYNYSTLLYDMLFDSIGDLSLDYFKALDTDTNITILQTIARLNGLPYGNDKETVEKMKKLLREEE